MNSCVAEIWDGANRIHFSADLSNNTKKVYAVKLQYLTVYTLRSRKNIRSTTLQLGRLRLEPYNVVHLAARACGRPTTQQHDELELMDKSWNNLPV